MVNGKLSLFKKIPKTFMSRKLSLKGKEFLVLRDGR